jgi:hypothetical protein
MKREHGRENVDLYTHIKLITPLRKGVPIRYENTI